MTLNPHPVVFEAAADACLWCDATGFRLFSTAHVSPAHCDQCRQQHAAVPIPRLGKHGLATMHQLPGHRAPRCACH